MKKSVDPEVGINPAPAPWRRSIHAGNALVKNHSGRAYIKIINTRDIDERIIALEVELEELDKIATSRSKKPSSRDRNVQTHAVNVIATDDTQNYSLHEVAPYGNSCVWTTLTKGKQPMWIEFNI